MNLNLSPNLNLNLNSNLNLNLDLNLNLNLNLNLILYLNLNLKMRDKANNYDHNDFAYISVPQLIRTIFTLSNIITIIKNQRHIRTCVTTF